MSAVVAMVALALACWVFRVLFIVLVPAHRLPAVVTRGLAHLAPSVLAALVVVETRATAAEGSPAVAAYVVGAVVLMVLVARRTGSLLWTIGVGSTLAVLLDLVIL
jgi:branched-subunit amino acid transport protein